MIGEKQSKYFDIVDGALGLGLFLIYQFIFYLLIGLIPSLPAQNSVAYQVILNVLQVILSCLFALASFTVVKLRRRDFRLALTYNHKVNGKLVGTCLGIAVISLIFFIQLTSAFMLLLDKVGYVSPTLSSADEISNFGTLLVSIVVSCLIPAFCEEMLFRGVLLNSLRSCGKWVAIIVTAAMFMLVHGNPDQTMHQFVLGVVVGYVAWETKSLWLPFLIHFFNNFIAVLLSYVMGLISKSQQAGDILGEAVSEASAPTTWGDVFGTLAMAIVMAIIGVIVVKALVKTLKKNQAEADSKAFAMQSSAQVSTASDDIERLLSSPIATGHLASSKPEGHMAEDHSVLQADLLADGLEGHAGEYADEDSDDIEIITKHSKKPSGAGWIVTIIGYASFIGYFAYEWISILIKGLH